MLIVTIPPFARRLVALVVSHGTEVQRVAATLVADFANTASTRALLPQVKVRYTACFLHI